MTRKGRKMFALLAAAMGMVSAQAAVHERLLLGRRPDGCRVAADALFAVLSEIAS